MFKASAVARVMATVRVGARALTSQHLGQAIQIRVIAIHQALQPRHSGHALKALQALQSCGVCLRLPRCLRGTWRAAYTLSHPTFGRKEALLDST